MNILIYKALIDLKKKKVTVPDLSIDEQIPSSTFEEAFEYTRDLMTKRLKTEYFEKELQPPERDKADFPNRRGQDIYITYIDVDVEMLESENSALKHLSKIDKTRIFNTMYCNENVIEWMRNDKTVTVTLSQPKYINKVKKIAESNPDAAKIIIENEDGSIYAKMLRSCIRINAPASREMTEEEKEKLRERLAAARERRFAEEK